jgi:putative ABC transport system permease protein
MSSPSEGRIGFKALVSEAIRVALSLRVATSMTLAIAATCSLFVVGTIGQTVRAEQDVLGRIDEAGTRTIVVTDERGAAGLTPDTISQIERLSGVEWVVGLGFAVDGRNVALPHADATPVAVRTIWGEIPPEISIAGRQPRAGEAIVGPNAAASLGLAQGMGAVEIGQRTIPVVAGFHAYDALADLNASVLVMPVDGETSAPVRSIRVLARSPGAVAPLAAAILEVLGQDSAGKVSLETSSALADVRSAVGGELGQYGRQLVLAAFGASLALIALVTYAAITQRRQDFGRRRALGATRADIVAMVGIQSALTGGLGAGVGTAIGSVIVIRMTGGLPDAAFLGAVMVLATYVSVLAALPPALAAALRDPVRVLRVP